MSPSKSAIRARLPSLVGGQIISYEQGGVRTLFVNIRDIELDPVGDKLSFKAETVANAMEGSTSWRGRECTNPVVLYPVCSWNEEEERAISFDLTYGGKYTIYPLGHKKCVSPTQVIIRTKSASFPA